MLSKCIGIISYFPDGPLRDIRKKNFNNLIKTLNDYFKLPIVIIAQNWKEEDLNIKYDSSIKIYNWKRPLGITGANIKLREKLLLEPYDYFIHLDDDIEIVCGQEQVNKYLNEIDSHPNMFGQVKKFQLAAQSRYMLEKMDFDYIKNMESYRGEIWEDLAYMNVYKKLYPNKFFEFKNKLTMTFKPSEQDPTSTWYDKSINQKLVQKKTNKIINDWYNLKKRSL